LGSRWELEGEENAAAALKGGSELGEVVVVEHMGGDEGESFLGGWQKEGCICYILYQGREKLRNW
jgi:hypothetical protein